ncbi:biosynthetic-type acetolactate synthase large subunit [Bacillus sp. EB600]|uniref:biosynthetic-type acetolactate synthase large subunit n=1 Tax=Bacillus sp. EB600 TaxID=2806345 RepID=UPI00210D2DB8|nr:biosynthetic-type acetolactate synthase large subunit [Bacillus sp. EB600]
MKTTEVSSLFGSLETNGVEIVFSSNEEELLDCAKHSSLRFFQLKHEQGAVHAADGYARVTGKPGVVILTTAAGVANGITGMTTAYGDSVPLVVIAGPLLDKCCNSSFQEFDIAGVTMPITKHTFYVNNFSELEAVVRPALTIAGSGRPGPVLIEFTPNAVSRPPVKLGPRHGKESKPKTVQRSIELAAKYIESARKPVLFIGGGAIISGASELLTEFAQQARIPVVSSLMGIGAFQAADPLYLGMLGMHGTFAANKAVHHCDLLISIGVRFSDRTTGKVSSFSPKSKKIHVDIDSAEINKIIQVDLPIVGDAKEFLCGLKEQVHVEKIRENTEIWVNEVTKLKRTVPRFEKSNSILSPQTVIRMLDEFSSGDAIVVTDVGQHQMWTANNYTFTKPRTLITSGGLGTMGYGLPAAIGAAGADPTKQIICVSGDGSFQMNLQEIITAVSYQLPIKIAIMNNGYLGMVRQWQEMFHQRRYSAVKITSPNFAKLAEAYGAVGFKASTEEEARQVIKAAFAQPGPFIMEFDVIEEENVFPIVPPNQGNDQVILSR